MDYDRLFFLIGILGIVGVLLLVKFRSPVRVWDYLKANKGVAKGIVLVVLVAFSVFAWPASAGQYGVWWNHIDLTAHAEYTREVSRFCVPGSADDRWTSNLRADLNIFKTHSNRFFWDAGVGHHSCIIGADRDTYDALSTGVTYRINL